MCDTVGLLIDNHSKTHMIFIWSVLYSRCISFVMICSGTFAWSRCCGLLGRRLERECAVHLHVGNPGRWQHGSRRLWQWSNGSSLSASEQGTRAAGSEMVANSPQPPCTRTVSWCCCQMTLLLTRTGCPFWCVGNVLALLDIAAGFLDACLNILLDVSSAGCRCWMNNPWAETTALLYGFLAVHLPFHWLVGRFGRCGY